MTNRARGGMIAGLALALSGCAMAAGEVPGRATGDAISYEVGPCFGTCPVYRVTVYPDGNGVFEGRRFTAIEGERAFTATPEAYRRFAALLAPYRPRGERRIVPGTPDCGMAATDSSIIEVRWGRADHLTFYTGCRMNNDAMASGIAAAPSTLPIADLVGGR